jgi:hypothetical protein
VHTEDSFWAFVDRERLLRRSPLLHMCAHGLVIRDGGGRIGGPLGSGYERHA